MQKELLDWYHKNHRKLPWIESSDPYKIWLSEIMLQQTQVATVVAYFNRFISNFPTVYDLAQAEEDQVLKMWEGLGYYSRARRLIPCAKMVVEVYDGHFPNTYNEIIKLPGVGSYTAGAVLSIAYNVKVPAVDGNVMRVYSRYFDMANDISVASSKKVFEEKVMETLPEDRRHFNQALMELGARICTPKNYQCNQCPIHKDCQAKKQGLQDIRPVKTKKIKKRHEKIAACYIKCNDKIMLMKRPSEGLLAGLWAFPIVTYTDDYISLIKDHLKEDYDLKVDDFKEISTTKHVYTHLVWDMILVEMSTEQQVEVDLPKTIWVSYEELKDYALPTGFHKLLKNATKNI
ncbi:A/G-specific adenine glycosylase [Acidaminobacter sp. JC074]|uniref:A/G-specific adenine glycosylase n=1 Tax=Acidaminobacter sp. JC074 TaxID=2530199 RepID=UPI001F10230D|nr:A/G-specific adenine glycosylase [Acidaminobacter sp. JC074]MCH4888615.1 A/G-specific adenine glycosylase [Acidaminobacter sp. JC074]